MPLDVWSEHAGRRTRRPLSGAARIDHGHLRAARRELVGDGAAHDARADDGDLHMEDCTGVAWVASVAWVAWFESKATQATQ
jgi:hypothetical protein